MLLELFNVIMEAINTNDSNLNSLKSMVLDEGKLVTYITLSKDLCIHVNSSKLLMKKFVKTVRREQPKLELNINYLISGLVEDTKVKISVCSEDELDDLKKSFKVVFFVHEYSISKGSPSKNYAAFVSLNKYDDLNLCPGIIKSHDTIKRSHEEITNLKSSSQDTNSVIKSITPQIKPKEIQAISKAIENGKIVKTEPNLEKETKKEVLSPQKEQKSGKKINNKPSTKKGIAGFFNKQNDNAKKDKQQPIVPKVEKYVSDEKMDLDVEEDTKIKNEVKKENGISEKNKVLNHIKKNSKVDKKRKRVLRVSDSESEEENDPFVAEENNEIIHESDDEIPPTPAANNLKILTGIVNPRKKRKVVDKTYMSDDGFIITKREEVYESCSDTESMEKEQTVKQEIKEEKHEMLPKTKLSEVKTSPQKKKKISPPKGKQPTLMNFFKKK